MYNIKDMVRDGKKANFVEYRRGEMIYVTECGFKFPVPIDDTGDGIFHAEEKAMLLMRYIRKQVEALNKEKASIEINIVEPIVTIQFTHHLLPHLYFLNGIDDSTLCMLNDMNKDNVAELDYISKMALSYNKAIITATK